METTGETVVINTLKVQKLHTDAQLPVYATPGSARFDFTALDIRNTNEYSRTIIFGTGLAFEIPEGWEMVVMGRSGHGFKHNIRLANCEGVIDSDYRGELMIALTADSVAGWEVLSCIQPGERIAQGKLQSAPQIAFQLVDELSETSRKGGFGSTGNGALNDGSLRAS